MAQDFIEEIYSKSQIIPDVKMLISYGRKLQGNLFMEYWGKRQEFFAQFCRETAETNYELGNAIWQKLVECTEELSKHNFGLVADYLEEVLTLLFQAMELCGNIDVTDEEYRLFSSKSGFLCVQDLKSGDIMHSIIDPVWEAHEKADALYTPRITRFYTLGCELGYLSRQMYLLSNESIEIYIYDINATMTQYAMEYGVLGNIPREKIHITIESDQNKIQSAFMKQTKDFMRGVAVLNLENNVLCRLSGEVRDTFVRMQIMISTSRNYTKMIEHNVYRNLMSVSRSINEIKTSAKSQQFIVVGAGPSVDYNLEYLKAIQGQKVIIAAVRICEKLLQEGIKPDYIVAIDPSNKNYDHIREIQRSDMPLLLTDSANWQFGDLYKGDKYLIPTPSIYCASAIYERTGETTWDAEGTVASMCIDIAARFSAKTIEMVGIDLAYPTEYSHAAGVKDGENINREGMIKVKSVNGAEVYTDMIFRDYIYDIEEQIANYRHIKFYNRSNCGAYIRGCED